ncbi:MAG: hypothetical protein OD814_001758 [Candidatus Alkanophagales archaeon MCA70_species_1]|nr:hypothetical protein [Candidatus Alkanophaga volatiphilum]
MISRKLVIAIVICIALLIPIQLPKEVERGEITPTVLALEAPRGLENESAFIGAGISAYTNIGKQINLSLAEEAFKGVELRGDGYVIGIVSVSGSEDDDVHVYVQKDGWIVAYYLDRQPVPRIIKDLMNPADNKLEDALTKVCEKLNVTSFKVNYYHFKYPEANAMLIAGDKAESKGYWSSGRCTNNAFNIIVPSNVTVYEICWYFWAKTGYKCSAKLYINGKEVSSVGADKTVTKWSTTKVISSGNETGVIVVDKPNEIKVQACGWSDYWGRAKGGITVIYKI